MNSHFPSNRYGISQVFMLPEELPEKVKYVNMRTFLHTYDGTGDVLARIAVIPGCVCVDGDFHGETAVLLFKKFWHMMKVMNFYESDIDESHREAYIKLIKELRLGSL